MEIFFRLLILFGICFSPSFVLGFSYHRSSPKIEQFSMKNTLTQKILNSYENRTFSLQQDYTLIEDVILPPNCTLEFCGGSLKGNHTITGRNTCVRGNVRISPEVKFEGSFNNISTVYVDWFVDTYKANVDCSEGIRNAICFAKLARASLSFGGSVSGKALKYYCTSGNFDISGIVVHGNGSGITGVGDYDMFVVDGDCEIRDLSINKYPYQDGTSNKDFGNSAIVCKNNHHVKFDNVCIDGFHYGFLLEAAWNVVIDACSTRKCSVGIKSKGLSVNNNICNSRIAGTVFGIEAIGTSEGWMISDNLIMGSTGISFTNHSNSIVKGNIIDLCRDYAIRLYQNCPGILIDNNYMAIEEGGRAIVEIKAQDIKNNEDQMISITNNVMRGYGSIQGDVGISISSGKYKHIKIIGNHIKSSGLQYGINVYKSVSICTLFIRDNLVEGKDNKQTVNINGEVEYKFITDNVKTRLD